MDLALDAQRQPVDQLGRPWSGGHHDPVETAAQVGERPHLGLTLDVRDLAEQRGDGRVGVEDAGLPVEHRDVARPDHVAAITPA